MEYQRNEQAEQTKWYVYDGLGSVLSEVDEDGDVVSDCDGVNWLE